MKFIRLDHGENRGYGRSSECEESENIIMEISKPLRIGFERSCKCPPNHINCLTAKEWIQAKWQFGSSFTRREMYVIRMCIQPYFPLGYLRSVYSSSHIKGSWC